MGNIVSSSDEAAMEQNSIFDFEVEDKFGKMVSLKEKFQNKGKKIFVIVNVASACGLTQSNYAGLVSLYEKFQDKGLEIILFPCNNFGQQEKGSNEECQAFAIKKKVNFPMLGKIECENGEKTHILFKFLKMNSPPELWGILGKKMKWNFTKFVCDEDGKPIMRFGPWDSPASMIPYLEKILI